MKISHALGVERAAMVRSTRIIAIARSSDRVWDHVAFRVDEGQGFD